MTQVVQVLDVEYPGHWIFKPYHHWIRNVAEDWTPTGFNSKWFHDWVKATYNLDWDYKTSDGMVRIHGSEEDWMRFYLEWG